MWCCVSIKINVFAFFILSKDENVTDALLFNSNSDISNGYSSDMKVVAAFRPRCCGRTGEPVPTAAMNILRKIWVSSRLRRHSSYCFFWPSQPRWFHSYIVPVRKERALMSYFLIIHGCSYFVLFRLYRSWKLIWVMSRLMY